MNGQLWQECFCGTEPVCATCECCEGHCTCPTQARPVETNSRQADMLARVADEMNGIGLDDQRA